MANYGKVAKNSLIKLFPAKYLKNLYQLELLIILWGFLKAEDCIFGANTMIVFIKI